MGDLLKGIEFLGVSGTIVTIVIVVVLLLQIVGEIVEHCGKIAPAFMRIRKNFKDKKKKQEEQEKMLKDINEKVSAIDIKEREAWKKRIEEKNELYDQALINIKNLEGALSANTKMTLDLYINYLKSQIIDFSSKVANEKCVISREEFKRVFRLHKEYEEILEKNNMTNGEVDISYKIIEQSYKTHLVNHSFLEDIRGISNKELFT